MSRPYWEMIQLDQVKKIRHEFIAFSFTSILLELDDLITDRVIVGVDPGIHYGLTVLDGRLLQIFWGDLPKRQDVRLIGLVASELVQTIVKRIYKSAWENPAVFIEGPSYNDRVGQPLLEQVRFGFAVGFSLCGYKDIEYMPPMTARKLAFGKGTTKAKDIWVNIKNNAADSIGLALAGAVKLNQS